MRSFKFFVGESKCEFIPFSHAFIFLFTVFIFEQVDSYDYHYQRDTSVECLASYLKEQNESDEYLNSLRVYDQISQECRAAVAYEKENLLAEAQLKLQFRSDFKCLQNEVQGDERIRNLLVKLKAVNSMSDSSAWIGRLLSSKKTPKEQAIDRVDAEITVIILKAEVKCELTIELGLLFDSFFERHHSGTPFVSYEPVQEYCIRKELEDNAVIDLHSHRTSLNPESLKAKNTDCREILNYIQNEMIDSLNDFDSENYDFLRKHCFLVVLKESTDYFHQILKAEFMIKLHLSFDEKQIEKKSFIDKLINVALKIRERCS